MADIQIPSPEETHAIGDPGDETASRYRFQWTWAAVVCCMLFDDTVDVDEVFCEHHEDVLLKHQDGTFTGHQVKTRDDDQPPWKATDEAVIMSCARFAKLESRYPTKFRSFIFLTNHPLYSANNGKDLTHILKLIKNTRSAADLPAGVWKWIQKISKEAGVSEQIVVTALSKTEASAGLPKLRDIVMRLIDTISQCWDPADECSHESVKRAAQALIDECARASSLDHEQLLPAYIIASVDGNADMAAKIDGKRMTLDRVHGVLERGRDCTATLAGDPSSYVKPGDGSSELLQMKLDAGGFSVVSKNSAKDLRDKADYLGIGWTKRYGHDKGLERYNHIRSIVLNDAGSAFEATKMEADDFGPAMKEEMRRRFRERRAAGHQLYDCTDEHLEGVAYSLTAQCEVHWSHKRPWESI